MYGALFTWSGPHGIDHHPGDDVGDGKACDTALAYSTRVLCLGACLVGNACYKLQLVHSNTSGRRIPIAFLLARFESHKASNCR